MRKKIYLSFNEDEEVLDKIERVFKEIGKMNVVGKRISIQGEFFGFRVFWMWLDDPKIDYIEKVFKENGWKLSKERIEHVYEPQELMQCKLLLMRVNRAPKGDSGPTYGTKFDMNRGCKTCGSGAIQISELILRSSDIPKKRDVTQTFKGEILVSRKVRDKLLEENILNIELRPVLSYKRMKQLNYYQIIPLYSLPSFSKNSKGIKIWNQCEVCNLDGYFDSVDIPLELHYENINENVLKKTDIFFTHEHFGISKLRKPFNESGFAVPKYLVAPKVFKVFQGLKIKEVSFEPVIINGKPDISSWLKKEAKP